jgi:hypothetical protein
MHFCEKTALPELPGGGEAGGEQNKVLIRALLIFNTSAGDETSKLSLEIDAWRDRNCLTFPAILLRANRSCATARR